MNIKKTAVITAIAGVVLGASFAAAQVTTTSSCYQFERNLRVGNTGADVKALQQTLNANGFTVAAAGHAGSAGMETSYYGNATKMALIKWQEANAATTLAPWGLTSGTGFFGATSRAEMNKCAVGTPTTPGTGTVSGTVAASLASAQPNNVLVKGSARNIMANLTFTGTGIVTNVTLQRIGISNNNVVESVYLVDASTQQIVGGATASINNDGTVSLNNPAGLFTVNGSANISIAADLPDADISGQSVGFALAGYTVSGSAAAVVSGLNGPVLPIGSANLAKVVLQGKPTSDGTNINVNSTNVSLWRAAANVNINNVRFSGITFSSIGSMPTNAFANYRLYVDGIQTGNAVSMDNFGRVSFLFNPVTLNTGSHTIELRADNQTGSGRFVQFAINTQGEALFQDANIGAYVSLTSTECSVGWNLTCAQSAQVTVGQGSTYIEKDPSFTASTLVSGNKNQTIAKFRVNTYGEDQKAFAFEVTPSTVETLKFNNNASTSAKLNNLALYINGSQYGQTFTAANLGATSTYNVTYTFPANTVTSVEVKADVETTDNNVVYPIESGKLGVNLKATVYGYGVNGMNASGLSTTLNGSADPLSVQSTEVNLGVSGSASQNISKNTDGQSLGKFVFQNGNNGTVTLNEISLAIATTSGSVQFTDIKNVTLKVNGSQVGIVNSLAQASMRWNVGSIVVGPNGSANFEVFANIGNNAGTITVTPTVSYYSGISAKSELGSAVTNIIGSSALERVSASLGEGSAKAQAVTTGSIAKTNFMVKSETPVIIDRVELLVASPEVIDSVTVGNVTLTNRFDGKYNFTGITSIEPVKSGFGTAIPVTVTFKAIDSNLNNKVASVTLTYIGTKTSGVSLGSAGAFIALTGTSTLTSNDFTTAMSIVDTVSADSVSVSVSANTLVKVGTITVKTKGQAQIKSIPVVVASEKGVVGTEVELRRDGNTYASTTSMTNIVDGTATYDVYAKVADAGKPSVSLGDAAVFIWNDSEVDYFGSLIPNYKN